MNLDELKYQIEFGTWEAMKKAGKELAKIHRPEDLQFLHGLLENPSPAVRKSAALALEQIGADESVEPLLQAIFKWRDYSGTLVFALKAHNCEYYLLEIFRILFYHAYESKFCAMLILDDQIFSFTRQELRMIEQLWQDCLAGNQACQGCSDEETRAQIQNCVDGFLAYLD